MVHLLSYNHNCTLTLHISSTTFFTLHFQHLRMKIILAPDKFKGSLTAFEVCEAMEKGIRFLHPHATVQAFPMADGGDGFGKVLSHYLHTRSIETDTVDPLGRRLRASYEWQAESATAIIELAAASGLTLLKPEERDPMYSSTYGTGLQIKDALQRGARHIILGLGGSATNDGGTGLLHALGFRWLDAAHKELKPCGKHLHIIEQVEVPTSLPEVQWTIACDVNNPMHGANGAAFVYAPQKGANAAMVAELDAGLRHFETLLNRYASTQVGNIPGTGAAVAGMLPWLQPDIRPGIELLISASAIEKVLPDADLLITGEGKLDSQSLQGKVVGAMAALGNKYHIPVAALCGIAMVDNMMLAQAGIGKVGQLVQPGRSAAYCMQHAATLIEEAIQTFC